MDVCLSHFQVLYPRKKGIRACFSSLFVNSAVISRKAIFGGGPKTTANVRTAVVMDTWLAAKHVVKTAV